MARLGGVLVHLLSHPEAQRSQARRSSASSASVFVRRCWSLFLGSDCDKVARFLLWTRIRTPWAVMEQLAEREDSQIGFQELLGIVLALGTFHSMIAGALWVAFCDNDGVTHAITKGGGHYSECNLLN